MVKRSRDRRPAPALPIDPAFRLLPGLADLPPPSAELDALARMLEAALNGDVSDPGAPSPTHVGPTGGARHRN